MDKAAEYYRIKAENDDSIMATPLLAKGRVAVVFTTDECTGVVYMTVEKARILQYQLSSSIKEALVDHGEQAHQ